ncbi:MAG: fumarate hydratase [Candidatus Altiarchaeales archaeon ex4484_2]|nr:MAG: fumarate hydratase [Candidatus Altiarchaeales archaeon ex4484_2]
MDGEILSEALFELIRRAVVDLPGDVELALREARDNEKNERAKTILGSILENVELARRESTPICQDTGVLVFYVRYGTVLDKKLVDESIIKAVQKATGENLLRPNIVHPLTRVNSNDNTGVEAPIVYYERVKGMDYLEVTVLPKGAGSENTSTLGMLDPARGVEGVEDFIVDSIKKAGGKPCPPTVVGVGIGGSSDKAMYLAKKALLRDIGSRNPDKEYSDLEKRLYGRINELGIGPMGVGGDTTCLAVHVEDADCHTASLPVAVNPQCWAARKAEARV